MRISSAELSLTLVFQQEPLFLHISCIDLRLTLFSNRRTIKEWIVFGIIIAEGVRVREKATVALANARKTSVIPWQAVW